jgi:uncharacterized protein (DUF3084 family)
LILTLTDIIKDKDGQIKQLIEDKDSISKDKDDTIKQLTESFGSIIKQHGEQLAHRDNVIKQYGEQLAHRDSIIKEKDGQLVHRENVIKEKDGQLVHSENVIKEKDGQIADYVKKLFQMKEDLKNLQLQQSGTNTNSLLNSNGKRARSDPTSPNSTQKADNTSSPLILLSPNSYEYISAEISNDSFVETFEYNQSNSESIS